MGWLEYDSRCIGEESLGLDCRMCIDRDCSQPSVCSDRKYMDGVDVSREQRQGMGPLPGNAGACVVSVVRELAGRRMLAFPGNTATRHICYRSIRG